MKNVIEIVGKAQGAGTIKIKCEIKHMSNFREDQVRLKKRMTDALFDAMRTNYSAHEITIKK